MPRSTIDLQNYPVLCVDDEDANLVTLRYALGERFRILTARSGQEALEVLSRTPVAVLLCDQRMPNMTGVELCRRALELRPSVARMLITAYSDVSAVISAINQGQVTRFLLKPWRPEELEQVLGAAIEIAHLKRTVLDLEKRLVLAFPQRVTLAASAAVVHELSNPMAALTMASSEASRVVARVLEAEGAQRAGAATDLAWLKELHDEIGSGVAQLNGMLRRMRESWKSESIVGRSDLKLVVDSAVRMVRHQIEPHARLEVSCGEAIEVGLEASVLAEIVLNLLLNACQTIKAAQATGCTIRVEGRGDDTSAVVVVSDDGPGVAREQIEGLFDARFSTHGDGRGLGLLIVHDLVHRAGGTVQVESDLARGTRFDVRLPRDLDSLSE
jgi:signal transduction histidine kinase